MKKLMLTLLMSVGAIAVNAEGFPYLTFETTDGARVSVPVESLSLSISGTTLKAGSQSFTLVNLAKMYFSDADETTGIETIGQLDDLVSDDSIYDLSGKKIVNSKLSNGKLPHGVYIVKTKEKTYKIVVR